MAESSTESLKNRVRQKLLRQIAEDGGKPVSDAEVDDSRINAVHDDLRALEGADDDDPVIEELASRYWVP